MRVAPSAPILVLLPGQGFGVSPGAQTGDGSAVDIIRSSRAIGVSELSVVERIAYATMAMALVSSVAISMDESMTRVLVPDRLTIQVDYVSSAARTPESLDVSAASAPSVQRLISAIRSEPVEDGVQHPAEKLILTFARQYGPEGVRSALREVDSRRLTAEFLRLLARVTPLDAASRLVIVSDALSSSDLEIRDAGVQAAESWNDPALAPVLRAHKESVRWFADYVSRVAAELEA